MLTTRWQRAALVLLLVVATWGCFYGLGAIPLLDDPNEAQYAEVARELIETGDWLSPRLNYAPFLNKPPLAYWLIALADEAFGVSELAARVPSALAGIAIVALLVWLGALLFDTQTGLLAGFILLATGGFFIETHEVRPDLLLTAAIVGALIAVTYVLRRQARRTRGGHRAVSGGGTRSTEARWSLLALQGCLATGLLAKGMLGVVVPVCVIAVLVVTERRADALALFHPRRWWPFVLLAAPWHVVASLRHPGFLQDYVVNQHILFFFDQKVPRDSVPVPLGVFWQAFALRLFPWTLFAPLAIFAAIRRVLSAADSAADRMLLTWAATVLLLFSAASSRMEHYSIPAVPALSLLIAKLFRDYARGTDALGRRVVTAHVLGNAVLALATPFLVPGVVAAQSWLTPLPELPALARSVFALFAGGACIAAGAALAEWREPVPFAVVAAFVVAIPSIHHGLTLLSRIDSSAGLVAIVRQIAAPGSRVVYDAPVEYQSCAGLNFYLRRKLDLLPAAGFVPPRYLHRNDLFITRSALEQMWRNQPVVLVTGLAAAHGSVDGTVPQPFYVVAHDHARQVISNQPLAGDVGPRTAVSTGLP